MADLLKSLSTDELFFLLDCKKLKNLKVKFGEQRTKELLHHNNPLSNSKNTNNKVLQSLLLALTDVPTYPLLTFWTILDLVSLGFLSLTIVTLALSSLMLIGGAVYFSSSYKKLKKESEKFSRESTLIKLKIHSADILIDRECHEINKRVHHLAHANLQWRPKTTTHAPAKLIRHDKNRIHSIKDSIGSTIIISTTLFETYYLGVFSLVSAYGLPIFAAMMSSPLAVTLALTVSLGIGLYFGYKHYQVCQNVNAQKKHRKEMNNEINLKRSKCYQLKAALQQIKSNKHNLNAKINATKSTVSKKDDMSFAKNSMILLNKKKETSSFKSMLMSRSHQSLRT